MNLKNKRLCRILCGCIVGLLMVSVLPVAVSAEQTYPSYTYNSREQAVPTAMPYEAVKVFGAKELGLDSFSSPGDLYVADTGEIFVLDTDNSRIVVMNSDYTLNRVIIPKDEEGEQMTLNAGTGIYVHTDGRIVICGKSGFGADDILPLVEKIGEFPNICIKGLMAIPPISHNSGENLKFFQKMFQLSVDIKKKIEDNVMVDCLSMGMSGDYIDAIAAGSTMVRVGTAIFGARNYARDSSNGCEHILGGNTE